MSLIWPEMPEIRGMWENKWSSGHPLVPVARFLFRLHFSDLILSLKSWEYNNVGLLHESMAWFIGLAREVLHSGTLLNEWNVRAPYLIWLIFRYPVLPLLELSEPPARKENNLNRVFNQLETSVSQSRRTNEPKAIFVREAIYPPSPLVTCARIVTCREKWWSMNGNNWYLCFLIHTFASKPVFGNEVETNELDRS